MTSTYINLYCSILHIITKSELQNSQWNCKVVQKWWKKKMLACSTLSKSFYVSSWQGNTTKGELRKQNKAFKSLFFLSLKNSPLRLLLHQQQCIHMLQCECKMSNRKRRNKLTEENKYAFVLEVFPTVISTLYLSYQTWHLKAQCVRFDGTQW